MGNIQTTEYYAPIKTGSLIHSRVSWEEFYKVSYSEKDKLHLSVYDKNPIFKKSVTKPPCSRLYKEIEVLSETRQNFISILNF